MDKILYSELCKPETLLRAWEMVRDKNTSGGIDDMTIAHFEENAETYLHEIASLLVSGVYLPEPYKEIKIPKDDNEFRTITLPAVKDKIVQYGVKLLIDPIIEPLFSDSSYGYRPGKGPVKAIKRVLHHINFEKKEWIAVCDIDNFFDTIPHERFFKIIEKNIADTGICGLIRTWMSMGRLDYKMNWKEPGLGIPQGNILSPILSNLYLNGFDAYLKKIKIDMVRYADDIILACRSKKEAQSGLQLAKSFLKNELALGLNPGEKVLFYKDGFEFLGIYFRDGEISLSTEKIKSLNVRIEEAIVLKNGLLADRFFETIQGIAAYYGRLLPQGILENLDDYLVKVLKKKLSQAYISGSLPLKKTIREIMSGIVFFSDRFRLFKKSLTDDIVRSCKKTPKTARISLAEKQTKDAVAKRKREYQKLQGEGMELYVDTPGAYIGKTKNRITVKVKGAVKANVLSLNLMSITVTGMGVSISTSIIEFCWEKKIPVHFLGFNGLPYAMIYAPESFSQETGLSQLQAYTNGLAQQAACSIIAAKIKNQLNLVKRYFKYHKDTDKDFASLYHEYATRMKLLANEAKKHPEKDLDVLRGQLLSIEGRAAAAYWELMEEMLNNYSDFGGRVRQGAKDLVNMMLNYGYGILYSRINEAVVRAGLNPGISYIHVPQPGKPTLVYDLIEEFRQQVVDRAVFSLITKGEDMKLEKGAMSDATRKRLVEKVLERIQTIENFRGRSMRVSEIIKVQAKAFAAFIAGNTKQYKPYVGKW